MRMLVMLVVVVVMMKPWSAGVGDVYMWQLKRKRTQFQVGVSGVGGWCGRCEVDVGVMWVLGWVTPAGCGWASDVGGRGDVGDDGYGWGASPEKESIAEGGCGEAGVGAYTQSTLNSQSTEWLDAVSSGILCIQSFRFPIRECNPQLKSSRHRPDKEYLALVAVTLLRGALVLPILRFLRWVHPQSPRLRLRCHCAILVAGCVYSSLHLGRVRDRYNTVHKPITHQQHDQ